MAGYFGTAEQRRLQARAEENALWVATTPGACNSGRFIGCDDLDRLGWQSIEEIMRRDGAIGFRMLPKERVPEVAGWMTSRGYRVDFWEPFLGARDDVLRATHDVLAGILPRGLVVGPSPHDPTGSFVESIQRLMSESGVAPYSGSMLAGALDPALTVTIADGAGRIVACAFGHKPHNAYSAYHEFGYGGAVVVDPSFRGLGLGRYVNALIASRVLNELGGTHFYGFVSADNAPSRRMVASSGLKVCSGLVGAMAVLGGQKFTR